MMRQNGQSMLWSPQTLWIFVGEDEDYSQRMARVWLSGKTACWTRTRT